MIYTFRVVLQIFTVTLAFFSTSVSLAADEMPAIRPTWIVHVDAGSESHTARRFAAIANEIAQSKENLRLISEMPLLNTWIIEGEKNPVDLIPALRARDVEVSRDVWQPVKEVLAAGSTAIPRQWDLQTIKATSGLGKQGAGVKVGVIDSGVDEQHPALLKRLVMAKNFLPNVKEDENVEDEVQHGVGVASLIFGWDAIGSFQGVAPKAEYYSAKVCSVFGCPRSAVIRALSWSLQEQLDVVNMSLQVDESVITRAERAAISTVVHRGLTIVASAGNDGKPRLAWPASSPEVISVGSVSPRLERSAFSNFSSALTLVAPGEQMYVAQPKDKFLVADLHLELKGRWTPTSLLWDKYSAYAPLSETSKVVWLMFPTAAEVRSAASQGSIAFLMTQPEQEKQYVEDLRSLGMKAVVLMQPMMSLMPSTPRTGPVDPRLSLPALRLRGDEVLRLMQAQSSGIWTGVKLNLNPALYGRVQGTSFAAPLVTGAVSLMLASNPKLKPFHVKQILQDSADALSASKGEVGSGLLNATAAVQMALSYL